MRFALGRSLGPHVTSNLPSYHLRASLTSFRSFSTPPTAATEKVPNDNVVTTVSLPKDATTAGKVLDFLNTQCKEELTNSHIQALIKSCHSPADFPKILHAITTFKRTRNYVMDTPTADVLINTVLETSPYEGSLWTLENFKERTGLYYSATAYALNRVLDSLWQQVQSGNLPQEDGERIWKALQQVSYRLLQRQRCRDGRGLGKRAKKEYLKCLQTKGGPTEHTVRRVAQIGVALKNKEETMTTFIVPFQTANVWIHRKTLEWLEEEEVVEEEGGDDSEETVEEPETASEKVSEEEKKE
jgi:hypothetical protein